MTSQVYSDPKVLMPLSESTKVQTILSLVTPKFQEHDMKCKLLTGESDLWQELASFGIRKLYRDIYENES
jgi:hypothetical protein